VCDLSEFLEEYLKNTNITTEDLNNANITTTLHKFHVCDLSEFLELQLLAKSHSARGTLTAASYSDTAFTRRSAASCGASSVQTGRFQFPRAVTSWEDSWSLCTLALGHGWRFPRSVCSLLRGGAQADVEFL
jgi:hypothetical protein